MPNEVDTRIVQMQFDNKQFERGISQSEKSLDKFKRMLNFSDHEESLDKFSKKAKALSFDNFADNLQKLTDKFTGLGTMSERVLSQIRQKLDHVAASVTRFIDSMTTDQIHVGMEKFGQLTKNVQTIMAATGKSEEDVYRVLERLNEYTDQTSYNFTDMAANIGKFTSVGIPLEQAEKQMEGIANWAARSGGGISEASRAMYNLSQAMGVGALTKIDWKSIENASMATKEFKELLIQAGLEVGNLEKKTRKSANGGMETYYVTAKKFGKETEVNFQNLADTLSKKWADTTVLQRAFMSYYYDNLYYDEELETRIKVTQEQQDALKKAFESDVQIDKDDWSSLSAQKLATDEIKQAAIDAAVAQGNLVEETDKSGKTVYKTATRYGKQVEVTLSKFEESLKVPWLDKTVAKNVWAFDDLAKAAYESAQKCMTFKDVIDAWKDQLSTGWMNSYRRVFGDLSEAMELFSNVCNKVGEALGNLIDFRNKVLDNWVNLGGRDSLWGLIVGEVLDEGEVVAYEGAYGFLDVLNDIGEMIKNGFISMVKIFARGDHEGLLDDPEWMQAYLGASLQKVVESIRDFLSAMHDFFNATAEGSDKTRWEQVQDVVNAIFATFVLAYSVFRDIGNFVAALFGDDFFGPAIDSIIKLFSELGLTVSSVSEDASEGNGLKLLFDDLLVIIQPLAHAISLLVKAFSDIAVSFIQQGRENGTILSFWQSIVGLITKVASIIAKVGTPIITFFTDVVTAIGGAFQNGISAESLKKAAKDIKAALKTMIKSIFNFVPDFSSFEGFFTSIWTQISSFFSKVSEADAKKGNLFTNIIEWIKNSWNSLVTSFQHFLGNFKGTSGSFGVSFMEKINAFIQFLKDNASKIMIGLIGILGFVGIIKLIKLVKDTFKTILKGLEAISTLSKKGIKALVFGEEEEEKESIGDKMLKLAGALAIMTAALTVIANLDANAAWNALEIVGALAAVLALMALLITLIYKDVELSDAGAMFLGLYGIAASIGRVVTALLPLKDVKDMTPMIQMLIWIVGSLAVVALLAKNGALKFASLSGILAFCGGVYLLISSLLMIKDLKPLQLIKMIGSLIVILGSLGGFAIGINKFGGSMANSGMKEMAYLAAAIAILIFALRPLADMELGQLGTMALALAGILTIIGIFVAIMGHIKGEGLKGGGMTQLLAVSGAIAILMVAILPLALLSKQQIDQCIGALTSIFILVGIFTAVVSLMNGKNKNMAGSGMTQLIAVAGAIMMLVLAMLPLALLKPGQLTQSLLGILVLTGILGAFVVAVNKFAKGGLKDSSMIQLIALAGAIVLVLIALMPLALMEPDQIIKMLGSMLVICASFAMVLKESKSLKGKNALSAFLLMIGVAGMMYLFAIAIEKLPKDLDWKVIAAFAVGLAAIIGVIALVTKVAKGLTIGSAIAVIVAIAGTLAAIMLVVSLLAPMLIGSIGSSIQTLSAQLALIAGMIGDFVNKMNSFSEEEIESTKKKFEKLMEVVKTVKDAGSYIEPTRKFSECLLILGSGLKQFQFSTSGLKSIEESAAVQIIEKLLSYKDQFAAFSGAQNFVTQAVYLGAGLLVFDTLTKEMTSFNATPFSLLDKLMQYTDLSTALKDAYSAANRIGYLAGGLSSFVSNTSSITDDNPKGLSLLTNIANNADNLQTLTTLSLSGFADQMSALGGALGIYALGVKEASGIEIGEMPDVSGAIAILQSLTTGITDDMGKITIPEMPDESTLTSFGTQLAALAGGLIKFANASQGLGAGTDKAIELLGFMRDLKTDLTTENIRIVNTFKDAGLEGSSTLTQFGTDISALGGSLKSYSDNTKDFQKNQGALDALSFLSSLKTKLSIESVVFTKIFQDQGLTDTTLTQFGTDISALGGSLKTYSESTQDFKKNQAALDALDFFYELQEKLKGHTVESVIFDFFSGDNVNKETLGQFGIDIAALGEALAGFASNVNFTKEGDVKALDFQKALDALDVIQKLAVQLPTYGGLHTIIDGEQLKLGALADDIKTLGTALGQISDELSAVGQKSGQSYNIDLVKGALEAVKIVVEMAKILQESDNPDTPMNGYHYASVLTTMFDSLLECELFNSGADSFIDSIVGFMKKFQDAADAAGGINDSTLFTAFANLADGIFDMINTSKNFDFVPIGENISAGIATGIANGESGVVDTLVKVALAAYEAGKNELKINSPSKVFMELGSGISEGMAVGISDNTGMVEDATEDMALSGLDPAADLLSKINELFNSDFDTQPTITPILDLSDIEAKSGELDSLFSRNSVTSINASVQSSGDKAREAYQNGINSSIRDTMQASVANMQNAVISSQNRMISAMSSELAGIRSQIANIRIVLNTGVIAGGVTDGVDKGIGRNMLYASRRN